jgi:hypothetical protein
VVVAQATNPVVLVFGQILLLQVVQAVGVVPVIKTELLVIHLLLLLVKATQAELRQAVLPQIMAEVEEVAQDRLVPMALDQPAVLVGLDYLI